jgi:serine/threonine protein kinase
MTAICPACGEALPAANAACVCTLNTISATENPAIPGYKIIRVLGRGGMGVVHLAEDIHLKRYVAVKLISETKPDPRSEERFLILRFQKSPTA